MAKKKIDQRIRTVIENGVHLRHRSLFVIVGDRGKDQVVNLHYMLSKAQVAKRPSILWCYKKDLGFSSHRQKRIKQLKKKKQLGLQEHDKEDPFELFLTSTDIRYTYYHETDKILGNTFGMCVLQDFEALTPNLLARTIETVQGGGLVVFLLKTLKSLKQLYTLTMDVHARYRTETHHDTVARFNERFLLSLAACPACLVLDDELNVLPISSTNRSIVPIDNALPEGAKTKDEVELESLHRELAHDSDKDPKRAQVTSLVALARTLDQAKVVQSFVAVLQDHRHSTRTTFSLTAGRGRGKSAALGLALAGAIANGYGNVFVTAPSPENLKTLFEFLFKGLQALGYTEHLDYDIVQTVAETDAGKTVVRINVFKAGHRQTVLYIAPQDAHLLSQAELVLIDEAAAIPLPLVQAISTGPQLVFMASTISGYEGTGRSLSLKLIQQLRQTSKTTGARGLKELQLQEPIRYARDDPVEAWLHQLLCLDIPLKKGGPLASPHPDACDLYVVNRDTLFSYHKASETFLQRLMALCVASHYKNSPNDLQLLSDAPAHQLFVLLPPVDECNATSLPDVLCVIQVCLEGAISKQTIMSSLTRGKRSSGDLIPWTVSQQFQDDDFATLSGARVVRIAVNPDMQSMGYGSRAMQLLERYFQGELYCGEANDKDEAVCEEETGDVDIYSESIKPRANLKPLLTRASEQRPLHLHWLGVSFGLTLPLFKFWRRLSYLPIYIRQTPNDITGEHTAILLKALNNEVASVQCSQRWLEAFYEDFRRRFISLLAYQFRSFVPSLCLDILAKQPVSASSDEMRLSLYDLKRLESYANNMVDYHMIMDLLPLISRSYFSTYPISLSPVQAAILLVIGLQHRAIEDLEKELCLPASQLLAMFVKTIRKFALFYRKLALEKIGAGES